LALGLALIYVATLVFDPEQINTRDADYAWLDQKRVEQADRIELVHDGSRIELARRSGEWVALHNGLEYPAKQARVEDLLHTLSRTAPYPLRGRSAHERFGLAEEEADRIIVRGGLAEAPLLDLLVGNADALGAVYLRKSGQDEVRSSASSTIGSYALSSAASWYNLRLFPETSGAPLGVDAVQRVVLYAPDGPAGEAGEAPPAVEQTLARNGAGWIVSNAEGEQDFDVQRAESYIRGLLDSEGDDFAGTLSSGDPAFDRAWVRLELGNGTSRVIRLGPALENNQYRASAEGAGARTGFVFALSEWRKNTLFSF
jgi:hypothetical protein